MIQPLLLLPCHPGTHDIRIRLGQTQQINPFLDPDPEVRLRELVLHRRGLEVLPLVRVEPAQQRRVLGARARQVLEEGHHVRRVDPQDAVRPALVDVPLVQPKVEDLVAG